MAQRKKSGRAHRAAHRGFGCRALPPRLRRPAGAGPCMAGAYMGRGRQHRRRTRALLPERVRGHLYPKLPQAGAEGAGVPLFLLPLPAARRQRTPHLGRQRHLPGHLPGTDAGRDRGKAQKESPCLPPDGAGRGNHLYGRLHGHPHGEPAAGLRRLLPAPGRRGVCLSAGGGGGRCPHGRHRGGARGRSAFLHGAAAVPVPAAGLAAAPLCPLPAAAGSGWAAAVQAGRRPEP